MRVDSVHGSRDSRATSALPLQEVAIVEAHLRTLERRFLATLSRTPPKASGSTGTVDNGKWDAETWRDKRQNAATKDSDAELTLLGMQRCVPPFHL